MTTSNDFQAILRSSKKFTQFLKSNSREVVDDAITQLMVDCGWDFDYGPVATSPPAGWYENLMSQYDLTEVEVLFDGSLYRYSATSDSNFDKEWEQRWSGQLSTYDENCVRLARYLGHKGGALECFTVGNEIHHEIVFRYESYFKSLSPWTVVLPHSNGGPFTQFINDQLMLGRNEPTDALMPLGISAGACIFELNYYKPLQDWWRSTGLRDLDIEGETDLSANASETRLIRFSQRGLYATAKWKIGRVGLSDVNHDEFAHRIIGDSLTRLAQKLGLPTAPLPW